MKRSQSHIVIKCNSEKITYDLSLVLKKNTIKYKTTKIVRVSVFK